MKYSKLGINLISKYRKKYCLTGVQRISSIKHHLISQICFNHLSSDQTSCSLADWKTCATVCSPRGISSLRSATLPTRAAGSDSRMIPLSTDSSRVSRITSRWSSRLRRSMFFLFSKIYVIVIYTKKKYDINDNNGGMGK